MILDSNIVIYSAQPNYIGLARYLQAYQNIVRVSLISMLEVLGYSRMSAKDKLMFEAFFSSVEILPVSAEIINEEAIRLR
ncbi:hypothetical protein [Spirosoma sp.]|uniref:hypothetical protein n=1 Tax=Spirosoma sp. TaxID=1899569 RepID=UPI0026159AAC|nr:hypothetical protein [Spirosoma sp.]MCX6216090.1 hypothetical protein [Spirosoma sp.]